jgi:hypothetical protein
LRIRTAADGRNAVSRGIGGALWFQKDLLGGELRFQKDLL